MRKGFLTAVLCAAICMTGCADCSTAESVLSPESEAADTVVTTALTSHDVTMENEPPTESAEPRGEWYICVNGVDILCGAEHDGVTFSGDMLTLDNADIGTLEIGVTEGASLRVQLVGKSRADSVVLNGMSVTLCGEGVLTASRISGKRKDEYAALPAVCLDEGAHLLLTDEAEPFSGIGLLLAEGDAVVDCSAVRVQDLTVRGSAALNCTLCDVGHNITLRDSGTLNALPASQHDYTVYAGNEITLWHHSRMDVQSAQVAAVYSESGKITLWGEAQINVLDN